MNDSIDYFYVWDDGIAYGPVDLPVLVNWATERRVVAGNWIFSNRTGEWSRAGKMNELKALMADVDSTTDPGAPAKIKAGQLRRIKVFGDMEQNVLESIIRYMEPVTFAPFKIVVKEGDPADAVYFVIGGELRTFATSSNGKVRDLVTMEAGDMFGEGALLDHGRRSATVVANTESLLLRLSLTDFSRINREAPAVAAPLLQALGRDLARQLRRLTRTYADSLIFSGEF